MFQYDLPLEELQSYRLPQTREANFETFWETRLAASRAQPLRPQSEAIDYVVPEVRVERVSYEAFDGGRIVGWCITPA